MRHILVLGGLAQSLTNFRGPLIKSLLAADYKVTAAAPEDNSDVATTLAGWGASYRAVPMARTGMNPFEDMVALSRLAKFVADIRPDVFFGYTGKPVIYGLIAAKRAGVPRRTVMITGLGYAFTEGRELKRQVAKTVASLGYWRALRHADRVIFQNRDDEGYFIEHGLVRAGQTALVAGSGVDLTHYQPAPLPSGPCTFLLIARLLRDKGIYEYVKAARIVRRTHPSARFVLVGPLDTNPAAVKRDELDAWIREGIIEYPGPLVDVRPAIASCHVYVLPTYREGMPRTVLEAMALGRAVVTTDVPGSRETVVPGSNGYLVEARSPEALAQGMLKFLEDDTLAGRMGEISLLAVRQRFDSVIVCRDMLRLIDGKT